MIILQVACDNFYMLKNQKQKLDDKKIVLFELSCIKNDFIFLVL